MKYLRIILLAGLCSSCQTLFADDNTLSSSQLENYVGYGTVLAMLILFVVAMIVLLRAIKVLTKIVLRAQGYNDEQIAVQLNPAKIKVVKKSKNEVWEKLLSLRPLEEEKEILIEHGYDGIQELDNPVPAWFMYLFYGTIIFGIGYLLNYHVFHTGQLQYEEYKTEVAQADVAHKLYLSKAANLVDENTVKLINEPPVLASGGAIFKTNCVACHGDHAQGAVGPNLTDEYWLHGSKVNDLFKTVKYGVLTKGMPTWEKVLSPNQISDVVNYVKSLQGTNPANPKAPQGVLEASDEKKTAAN